MPALLKMTFARRTPRPRSAPSPYWDRSVTSTPTRCRDTAVGRLGRNGSGRGGIEIGDNDLPLGCDGSTRRGADAAAPPVTITTLS
jgi:hypothetical protein